MSKTLKKYKKRLVLSADKGDSYEKKTAPLWVRSKIPILREDIQRVCVSKILSCVSIGAKLGKEFLAGFNSIQRYLSLKMTQISFVCISKEKSISKVLDSLLEVALMKRVPVIIFNEMPDDLKASFKIKRLSCFGLIQDTTQINGSDESNAFLSAQIDDLRDTFLKHAFIQKTI